MPDNEEGTQPKTEGTETETGKEKESGKEGGEGKETPPADEKKFTQSDVNRFIKDEKKKWEKNKDLTEQERLQTENTELKKKLQLQESEKVFDGHAKKLGVNNPAALFRILKDELEYGDDGSLNDPSSLIKESKDSYPELFRAAKAGADGGEGQEGVPTTGSMNEWLRS